MISTSIEQTELFLGFHPSFNKVIETLILYGMPLVQSQLQIEGICLILQTKAKSTCLLAKMIINYHDSCKANVLLVEFCQQQSLSLVTLRLQPPITNQN